MTFKCDYNLEKINPDLYDDIDQLALDISGKLEIELQKLGIAISDEDSEAVYDLIRNASLNSVDY